MTKQQAMQIEKVHADVLAGSIADLKTLSDQLGEIDDLKVEKQKAQAELDYARKYLKQEQGAIKEAEFFKNKYLDEARAKQAECERLDKEIKEKSAQLAQINDHLSKIRQRLG
jgi:hypothetical protein